ncbi:MAG TPA: hypothetical protein VMB05_02380 [Solirubrobacteraceae bacterium]|nr:hypothetical protein [Solirubrobacteraceae bacterium]
MSELVPEFGFGRFPFQPFDFGFPVTFAGISDRRADRQQLDVDARQRVTGALHDDTLNDGFATEGRPSQTRLAGGSEQGVGRIGFDLQQLHRAGPVKTRVAGEVVHLRDAFLISATTADPIQHRLDVAAGLRAHEREVSGAFGVFRAQPAREQNADHDDRKQCPADQRAP